MGKKDLYVIVDHPFPPWDHQILARLEEPASPEERQRTFAELISVWFFYMLRREGSISDDMGAHVDSPIEYIYRQNTVRVNLASSLLTLYYTFPFFRKALS